MTERIPITVVSGFLGSGKTTLLNRLLNPVDPHARVPDRIAVVVNEIGKVGIDHELVRHIENNVVLLQSGCICCTVRGELVDALRNLFFAALQKKIPAFSRILIETTGLADPAPIMFTVQYEPFLKERYRYDGCITVIDGVYGREQLRTRPEAVQQATLADCIVLSKTDLADAAETARLKQELGDLNATAPQHVMQDTPGLAIMLEKSSLHVNIANNARMFGQGIPAGPGRKLKSVGTRHADVDIITVTGPLPVSRSAFSKAMGVLQTLPDVDVLRIKGLIRFQGEHNVCVVHGVHGQLYPVMPLVSRPGAEPALAVAGFVMVFIVRTADRSAFEQRVRNLFPDANTDQNKGPA